MSIKSTYGILRETAIQVVLSSIYKVTNEELAEILEVLPESYFRNYRIDGIGYSGENDSMINSVEQFFSTK